MPDYLPRRESALCSWVASFAETIAADPGEFGLDEGDVQAIRQVVAAYQVAYTRAITPDTRTTLSLLARNRARVAMLPVLRRYIRAIKANATVNDASRSRLGLSPADKPRMRVPVPTTRPLVQIVAVGLRSHHLHCSHLEDTDGRWKPAGAIGMQLFCHIGETAPVNPLDARFERFVTRPRQVLHFKPEQAGQTAHYYARWQTARGHAGPWSAVASRMIPA